MDNIFTYKEAFNQGLLSIAGSYFPIQEIVIIKQQQFLTNIFIYIKTKRTSFIIDFGKNSKDNNRIVDSVIEELNYAINKYKGEKI